MVGTGRLLGGRRLGRADAQAAVDLPAVQRRRPRSGSARPASAISASCRRRSGRRAPGSGGAAGRATARPNRFSSSSSGELDQGGAAVGTAQGRVGGEELVDQVLHLRHRERLARAHRAVAGEAGQQVDLRAPGSARRPGQVVQDVQQQAALVPVLQARRDALHQDCSAAEGLRRRSPVRASWSRWLCQAWSCPGDEVEVRREQELLRRHLQRRGSGPGWPRCRGSARGCCAGR